ncbi:hypothetical protein ODZ84_16450 [Chryseobacterium fluminis]|uniref:hypothetical protein n=1 Tax=Chryseobacterium fluminis TaxID=2983606 RepID=UPI00225A4206|nr:hypothetical protein [Chryseobacterium sp. MMS21-Ot14]UZT96799.1 hypothetical protein ODZ84_16450 [Chryseobacterium sp. MMS21-Ot14]
MTICLKAYRETFLKGMADFTSHIFLEFDKNKIEDLKKWMREFGGKVASCKKQLKENIAFKKDHIPGGTFYGFLHNFFRIFTS